ncbi:MAG: ATP synthase F1 subunit epsilon [bacterium]|nr:ATP synthase F1 subunit epsilon [bacterium]
MRFQLITPEKVAVGEEVESVSFMTDGGEITVLPHHTPLFTTVHPGELKIMVGSRPQYLASGSGVAHITGEAVVILTDLAERPEDIHEAAEEQARARALSAIAEKRGVEEIAVIQAQLEKTMVKLRVRRRRI